MFRLFSLSVLLIAALGSVGLARPLEKRGEEFGIYAFGDNISGLQIYYSNGAALLCDPTQPSNSTDMLPVTFTVSGSDGTTFAAHSESKAKTLTDEALYIANDGSDKVGFSSSAERSSGKSTDIWWLYGRYVMTHVEGATFFAEPTSDGRYTLTWSLADQSGTNKVLVTLRTIEPSTNSVLT